MKWRYSIEVLMYFCFKQKTSYGMRISDWSSDVCSSDLFYDPELEALWAAREPSYRPTLVYSANFLSWSERENVRLLTVAERLADPPRLAWEAEWRAEIRRATCRERSRQILWIPAVGEALQKTRQKQHH